MPDADTAPAAHIATSLQTRFGGQYGVSATQPGIAELARIAAHRSVRRYAQTPVAPELLRLLFACAFSAPTKSDLQQADIIHVSDAARRQRIVATIPDMKWILDAPVFLVFCGNNRRIRHIETDMHLEDLEPETALRRLVEFNRSQ